MSTYINKYLACIVGCVSLLTGYEQVVLQVQNVVLMEIRN